MPSFQDKFIESKGQPITYDGRTLLMVDRLNVDTDSILKVTRLGTNSEWKQGLMLRTKGSFKVNGKSVNDAIVLWEDTAPEEVMVGVCSKDGQLSIKNVWDTGNGVTQSWYHGAAMIVEDVEGGRRYLCNDGHPDENFDDIVFEISIV